MGGFIRQSQSHPQKQQNPIFACFYYSCRIYYYKDTKMTAKETKKLAPMEMEIMQVLWEKKAASIREIQESLPEHRQVEYTTVQTIVYRLEKKNAVKRARKIGNAHIFEPILSKQSAIGSLVEDFLRLFGGSPEPVMNHFVESGKLSLEDLKTLEEAIKQINENENE